MTRASSRARPSAPMARSSSPDSRRAGRNHEPARLPCTTNWDKPLPPPWRLLSRRRSTQESRTVRLCRKGGIRVSAAVILLRRYSGSKAAACPIASRCGIRLRPRILPFTAGCMTQFGRTILPIPSDCVRRSWPHRRLQGDKGFPPLLLSGLSNPKLVVRVRTPVTGPSGSSGFTNAACVAGPQGCF